VAVAAVASFFSLMMSQSCFIFYLAPLGIRHTCECHGNTGNGEKQHGDRKWFGDKTGLQSKYIDIRFKLPNFFQYFYNFKPSIGLLILFQSLCVIEV
jgi:hypothetical protein